MEWVVLESSLKIKLIRSVSPCGAAHSDVYPHRNDYKLLQVIVTLGIQYVFFHVGGKPFVYLTKPLFNTIQQIVLAIVLSIKLLQQQHNSSPEKYEFKRMKYNTYPFKVTGAAISLL